MDARTNEAHMELSNQEYYPKFRNFPTLLILFQKYSKSSPSFKIAPQYNSLIPKEHPTMNSW